MGAKQSSPSASPGANGRTRAYSGSDLPSSTSSGNMNRTPAGGPRYHAYSGASGGPTSSSQHPGARARSAGGSGGSAARPQSGIDIPNSSAAFSPQESGGSSPEDTAGQEGPRLLIGSLPAHLSPQLFGGKGAKVTRTCLHFRASLSQTWLKVLKRPVRNREPMKRLNIRSYEQNQREDQTRTRGPNKDQARLKKESSGGLSGGVFLWVFCSFLL